MASAIALNELEHIFEEFYKVNRGVWKLVIFIHTHTRQSYVHKSKYVGLGAVKPADFLSVSLSFLTESSHTSTHSSSISIFCPLLTFRFIQPAQTLEKS